MGVKEKFDGAFNSNYRKNKGYQNLSCVCIEETKEFFVITSLKKITNIKNSLIVKKKQRIINSINPNKLSKRFKIRQKKFFSLFVGIFLYKKKAYFIFVERVSIKSFPRKDVDIFEIINVIALSMETFTIDNEITKSFNIIFNKGFFFSYNFDMTKSFTFENIRSFKENKEPNWLYFTNRGFQKIFFSKKVKEWIVPVIFGMVSTKKIKISKDYKSGFTFIHRTSIPDLMNKKKNDPVVKNLTVSNHFTQIDFIMMSKEQYSSISFSLSDLKHRDFSYKQVMNYYQFILNNMKVNKFFYEEIKKEVINVEDEYRINRKSTFKSLPFQIIPFSNNDEKSIFSLFDMFFKPLVSCHPDFTNVISITSENIREFNTSNLCYLMALFINFTKDLILEEDSDYDFSKKFIKDTELEIMNSLKKHKTNRESLRDIFKNISKTKKQDNFFIKFMNNIIKITSSIEEDKKTTEKLSETKKMSNLIFGYVEEDIKFLVKEYNKEEKINFLPTFLNITFITHNCSGFSPDSKNDLDKFNYHKFKDVENSDILIIGLQEIMEMKSKNLKNIILEDNLIVKKIWQNFIIELFKDKFVIFYAKNLLGLLILVLIKPKIKQNFDIKILKTDLIRLGAMNFANKAAIFVKLSINYQCINIINCHLASGTKLKSFNKRIENLDKIIELLDLHRNSIANIILGDLNFRNRLNINNSVNLIKKYINANLKDRKKIIGQYLKNDELIIAMKTNFKNFFESEIFFLPSYKFTTGTKKYDFMEGKRIPSHTDRILFREEEKDILKIDNYLMDEKTIISDHKPVLLSCRLKILKFGNEQFKNIMDMSDKADFKDLLCSQIF